VERSTQVEPVTSADLYRLHRPFVRRCLRRLGVTPDRIEDAEQDVFVVLLRRLDELDLERGVRGWLWGVSRRVAWIHRKGARRRAPEIDGSVRPRQETRVAVQHALDRLDDKRLEVLVLAEVEGRSAREIAGQLGLPITTVQWRLRSARKILRTEPRARVGGWIPFFGGHAAGSAVLAPALASWAALAVPALPTVSPSMASADLSPGHLRSVRVLPWQRTSSTPTQKVEENPMPITLLTFSALLVAAPADNCRRGQTCEITHQDADAAARVQTDGPTTRYEFKGEGVEGAVWKPTGENIPGRVKLKHGSLLNVRGHFNAELIRLSYEL
jgi:RNA polymerase sigma factor (sigma-70 family)